MTHDAGMQPERRATHAHGRHDGISKLTGKVTFSTTGASMDMTITGGNSTGASAIEVRGSQGDEIQSDATQKSTQPMTRPVTGRPNTTEYYLKADDLDPAASNEDYTIRVSYTLNAGAADEATKNLEGTVAQPITIPGSVTEVSLTEVTV